MYDGKVTQVVALLYISAWCTSLCSEEPTESQRIRWNKAADDLLFTLAVSGGQDQYLG